MFAIFLLFALFSLSSGVIYELSDEDYARMPPMFRMDDYEECFEDPQGLYCSTKFVMVSDEANPLLTMMQEYSAHYPTHYNHTMVRRGICITRTCKQYYEVSKGDLGSALEACANDTFYSEYKLKARVLPDFDCSKRERNQSIDYLDITVAVVCVAILVANVVASIGDYFFEKERYRSVRFLYCFSIFYNWNRLVMSPTHGKHPRLIGIHGIRAASMFLVIGCHSIIKTLLAPDNERFIENMFSSGPMHIFFNGSLIMQTFMFISSFLLVYNWLIYSEKQKPTWKMLPNIFIIRWLRLTPSYALFLAFTATWYGKLASGPAWQSIIGNEMNECLRVWWKHLLYINNYYDNPECMHQTWYLAADTQLYTMVAIVFLLCRTPRMRKVVLSLMFVIGVAIPTVITYVRDLDGVVVAYPEFVISVFKGYSTFNEIYQRGHTNIPGYIVGMTVAYWVYDRQKTGVDIENLRKYRLLYWAMFPLGALCFYSGTIYYSPPPPSTFINLLYAAFVKPAFAILIGIGIAGGIFELEGVYRPILECSIWTIPSRLSYSAYLVHFAILKYSLAMQTTTYTVSPMTVLLSATSYADPVAYASDNGVVKIEDLKSLMPNSKSPVKKMGVLASRFTTGVGLVVQSFIAAFFYYILVEGPLQAIIREWYTKLEATDGSKDKDSKKKEEGGEINESIKRTIIAENGARKRVLNKIIDKKSILSTEKNR